MPPDHPSLSSLLRTPQARLVAFLWLALVATALMMRPLLPIDETRYLTVAWEMWLDGSYLVPHLNGETYSHKPPLMFWAMNLGWSVFGVSGTWARLVAPLFGLAALALTAFIARALWPGERAVATAAPVLLLGAVYWAVFATLTMFDTLLAFAALLALLGVIRAWRDYAGGGHFWRGMLLAGLGLGLGGLAKGPVILLHVLPVALLAPWWGPALAGCSPGRPGLKWKTWYGGVGVAVLVGLAVALAWAVPAAIAGGAEYRDAIFWGQSAGRMVESFAHRRPLWWFAQYLPVLLLPWFAWPRLWRGVGFVRAWRQRRGLRAALEDGGVRLVAVWFGVAFVAFSAISGKQLHYLLPEFPALALFGAYLLARQPQDDGASDTAHRVPALVLAGLAAAGLAAGLALPVLGSGVIDRVPSWAFEIQPLWLVVPAAGGLAAAWVRLAGWRRQMQVLALISAVTLVFLHVAAAEALNHAYDLAPSARRVAQWQAQGRPVAYVGNYHGEFHFLGRLATPLTVLSSLGQAAPWARANPTGVLLATVRNPAELPPPAPSPSQVWPYRGRLLVAWEAQNFPQ